MKNEIIIFENQNVKLEVNMKDESVWLNREQLSQLFDRDIKTIEDTVEFMAYKKYYENFIVNSQLEKKVLEKLLVKSNTII